jgi:hypothetical protein
VAEEVGTERLAVGVAHRQLEEGVARAPLGKERGDGVASAVDAD